MDDLDVEMIELELIELEMELDCTAEADPDFAWLKGQIELVEGRLNEALKAWN